MHAGYVAGAFCLALAPTIVAQSFRKSNSYVGEDFFSEWTWVTINDPTHGSVNYVDQTTAINLGLSYVDSNTFVMRADDTQVVPPSARGRDSVRIVSNDAYGDSLTVLDLQHMPEGCSTWPAFWTMSNTGPWPNGGEIDIIEGVNLQLANLASLHTTPGCNMSYTRIQSGSTISTDCDAYANSNQGCGTSFSESNSYGSKFNSNSGGWYVMKRTEEEGIQIWFWGRNSPRVPQAVSSGFETLTPDKSWGIPDAAFPTDTCDYNSHFDAHNMIFDLTFCGDWAGATYPSSGCGTESCHDFVSNNPAAFSNAYWAINSLLVYTPS